MAIAFFPSLEEAETIEVTFIDPQGLEVTLGLLVDSGFTGQSSFLLPEDRDSLAHAAAPTAQVAGAIQGAHNCAVVSCRIPALSFNIAAMAILANTTSLVLPPKTQGIVGLRFLRNFQRWGAEKAPGGGWRFFLQTA